MMVTDYVGGELFWSENIITHAIIIYNHTPE